MKSGHFRKQLHLSVSPSKVEKMSEDRLDSISSPSVKIQIIGGNIDLRYKEKTFMGDVNKLFVSNNLNFLLKDER